MGNDDEVYYLNEIEWDFEEYVLPVDIPDYKKEKILTQCKGECPNELYERIKLILHGK